MFELTSDELVYLIRVNEKCDTLSCSMQQEVGRKLQRALELSRLPKPEPGDIEKALTYVSKIDNPLGLEIGAIGRCKQAARLSREAMGIPTVVDLMQKQ